MNLTPADTGEKCDFVPPPWTKHRNDWCGDPATWRDLDSGFRYCDAHQPDPLMGTCQITRDCHEPAGDATLEIDGVPTRACDYHCREVTATFG